LACEPLPHSSMLVSRPFAAASVETAAPPPIGRADQRHRRGALFLGRGDRAGGATAPPPQTRSRNSDRHHHHSLKRKAFDCHTSGIAEAGRRSDRDGSENLRCEAGFLARTMPKATLRLPAPTAETPARSRAKTAPDLPQLIPT
jgi:hypothetical protein